MADLLKRLEEIGLHADGREWTGMRLAGEVAWLLKLTRALLESQGELIELLEEGHVSWGAIARAKRIRKGEV